MLRATILLMSALFAAATAGTAALSRREPSANAHGSSGAPGRRACGPRTIPGDIAMRNLEVELADAERRAAASPADLAARLRLASLVETRARITGDLGEVQRARAQTDACARLRPEAVEAWLARAEARTPVVSSLTRSARLEHDLGHHEAAEGLYVRALAFLDDPSPIPVAMLELQRGMNLEDAGRLLDAEETFRSAAERLPAYVAARAHLARTLHRLGRDHEALMLYEEITRASSDPEITGALAGLYREHGRQADADALQARAAPRPGAWTATEARY